MSKNAKKIINLFCVLVSCVMLSQLLVGCVYVDGAFYRLSPYTPIFQCETKWMSEDGKIYFEVNENCHMDGYILVEQTKVEVELHNNYSSRLILCDRYNREIQLEYLSCRFLKADMFIAKVEEATYLTIGETLVFRKIEDLKPEDDFHSN